MIAPSAKDIVRIVRNYCYQNGITISDFSELADVSKSWISRLKNEDSDVSLSVGKKMLEAAGYKLIVKHQSQLTKSDISGVKVLTDKQIDSIKKKYYK